MRVFPMVRALRLFAEARWRYFVFLLSLRIGHLRCECGCIEGMALACVHLHVLAAPVVWLRGDFGVSQVNKSAVSTWASASTVFSGDAVAPTAANQPSVVIDSLATPSYVRFDGVADGLQLSQSVAVLQRPMVIFMVDRYTPGSPTATQRRNLQGTGLYVFDLCPR